MRREPKSESVRAEDHGVDAKLTRHAAFGLQTLIAVSLSGLTVNLASGAELPIPCGTGTCGPNGPSAWITAGQASAALAGNSLTINQSSERLVLNWQQFNIGPDGQVTFRQPDASAVALNKIFQGDPVRILGTLQANGSVYLVNQNGILFGPNARVDVGGLIASTLDMTPDAVNGLLEPAKKFAPAFQAFVDAAGDPASGDVRVENGAKITAEGGQLFLLGSNVSNAGALSAPGGQIVIAAGDSVYLAGSEDSNLRGLLVEVGRGGVATNSAAGVAAAARGNVTMVGLMVNQEGRATATTSVRENGSVRLLARDGGQVLANGAGTKANNGGTLRLGPGSQTTVGFEHNDDDKTVDATPQARSFIELEGRTVSLESQSQVVAPSGNVQITAREDGTLVGDFAANPGLGRVVVAADSMIDVSGAQIERAVDTNILRVELRGSQLADSPVQRDGPLRGETAYVDIRRSGTRADGTTWVGSPIGDLAGDVATIQKTVEERSLLGGNVQIASSGAVVLESGSAVNVSGGGIAFTGATVKTSKVLGADGRVYDIGDADRDRSYAGLADVITVEHKKWGVTETFQTFLPMQGSFEPGYYEGKDAGSISITAPRAALDGALRGESVAGLHQRTAPTTVPSGTLYRSVNELPLAGRLILGTATATGGGGFLVSGVQVAPGPVLGGLLGPTGAPFDPLLDPLPDDLATVRVRPEVFGVGGLGGLTVYANGSFGVGSASTLDLGNAGQLAVTAGNVDIEGRIVAPGGSVSLVAQPTIAVDPGKGGVTLGSGASIDVAGRWINDAPTPTGATQHDALVIDGGAVALAAKGGAGLDLLAGSRIDVSAGANRQVSGSITAGRGGSIAISAAPVPGGTPLPVTIDSELLAYAVSRGGRLSLTLNAFCLADGDCDGAATGAYTDTAGTHSIDGFRVDIDALAADGFESVSLATNLGGIDIAAGTHLQPRERNYLWAIEPARAPTGTAMSSLTTVGVLPDLYRRPFTMSMTARPQLGDGGSIVNADFSKLGFVRVGTGAVLDFDVGASLTLQSSTAIEVDGTLSAPAGSIVLDVTRDLQLQEFVPNQGIWLGDHALLSAPGAVRALRDDLGMLRGSVLDGGSIAVRAERGYVATAQLSVLDASGASADLAVGQTSAGPSGRVERVASAGGSIEIDAAEGLVLNGALLAPAGQGSTAAGGSLRVTLDGNLHGTAASPVPIYPSASRDLHVVDGLAPVVVGPGQSLPADFYGRGLLPVERVTDGEFSSVELDALNLFDPLTGLSAPVSTGSIQFDGSMTLRASASLRLNAARLVSAPGSNVALAAPYVGLGYDDIAYQAQTGGNASPGTAVLNVSGDVIDLIGTLGLDGFGTTQLVSSGDIRLRGVESTSADGSALPIVGQLHAQGTLDFLAQQVYATTLTDYQVLLDGADHTRISVHTSPGTPGTVLSAGARVTFTADEIVQGGVLKAPLGEIVLHAQDLTLAKGSLTSTSAKGSVIPFGTLQVGNDWTYQLPRGQTALYTTSGPPAQRLELNAQNVDVAAGATIDLSGGGNLLAYEFVPGVTGTKDVLANDFAAGQFAIVPTLGAKFSPIDPAAQVGFAYRPGETVYLAGYGGLPSGEYAILPARYALLPGAYLVRPVAGYTDIAADEAVQRLDGSVVISGALGAAGTSLRDSRASGFAIYGGEQIAQQARYDLTLGDDFFSSRASAADTATPRIPRDAGQLQLIAAAHLDLEGLLDASVGTGGRGSRVDVSASQLRVVAETAASGAPGEVTISASQLEALGAESLLLGGLRSTTPTGTHIDTTADRLTVDGGVTLDAPTLTLVAKSQLEIESGATLKASGAATGAASELTLSGDGALLRVSTADLPGIARTDTTGVGGNLVIGAGALIGTRGSALLEASGTVDARASFDLAGGALGFSVTRLGFGDIDPANYTGLALSAKDLSSLNLRELSLTSATDIDFFSTASVAPAGDGSTVLRVDGTLALTAQSLNVHDAPTATIGADRLVLSGNGSAAPVAGANKLVIEARDIAWGGGSLAASGVNAVTVTATNQFRAEQSGTFAAAGDVKVLAPELVTGNGTDFAIHAAGALDVLGTGQAASATAAPPAGVGGSLTFEGSRVMVGTKLTLPSGLVKLTADAADAAGTPSIVLTGAAAIDVSGFAETFDGQIASGDGGLVRMDSGLGGISLAAGSLVDVSQGTGQGNAGRVDLRAPAGAIALNGTLRGRGAAGSGEIALDGASLPDLGALNRELNGAGFERMRAFHQRGAGDLVVGAGADAAVRATNVSITADGGSVVVLGDIDASGSSGGSIKLAARDNVDVAGALRADSSASAAEGGRVDLWTDAGAIFLRAGSTVSVTAGSGGDGGLVSLRAPRQNLLTVLDADPTNDLVSLGGQISGNRELDVEGYQRYTVTTGIIDATYTTAGGGNALYTDADTFMQSADALAAALARGATPTVVNPGIELQSPQALTLAADWNLAAWRFNGQPGVLTLRAGGDLTFQKSLSDGFAAITGAGAFDVPDVAARSWSYRLVAGADLNSSDGLAVQTAGTNLGAGKFTVAGGRVSAGTAVPVPVMVRTGTGSIDIATAADFVLTNRASVIYTAGANSGLGVALPVLGTTLRNYPTDGGDISMSVGGNIVGAPTNQLVTGWLWRIGRRQGLQFPQATGWNVNYQRFEQGIGALAGGDVTVRADGNIRDFSVSIATIGRQIGGVTADTSIVQETGGGTLVVESGGDLTGGSYYDGKGTASLRSWGAIGINTTPGAVSGLAPTLALGDTVMTAKSRRDLTLEAVVNPFLLPQASAQSGGPSAVSYFSTYSARSALHTMATGGDTRLINSLNRPGGLFAALSSSLAPNRATGGFSEAPATLDMVTLAGDMSLSGGVNMWPSPTGDLRIFANGDLNLAFPLNFPDVDPATLPTVAAPQDGLTSLAAASKPVPGAARVPIHSAAFRPDGQDDPEPVRIVATGDVAGAQFGYVGKSLRLISGGDITDLTANIENVSDSSLSLISAQGNIQYRTPRHPLFGYIVDNAIGVQVEGPGQLAIQAGGNIDLGSSLGVASAGNLLNPALSASGADISLLAGVTASAAHLDAFEQQYLAEGSLYDDLLAQFVQGHGGSAGATKAVDLAALRGMTADTRYQLAQTILFKEVRAGGRSAAAPGQGHDDYSRAFAAIETLFPGSTATDKSAYAGDISLFFSRVYTLDGGDISFVAPGGGINVGLATPPAAFGVGKQASSLGVVAQREGDIASVSYGDFQVNESRVFAADGGNILVWSTQGDIDAGRGAKTAIAAPAPTITFNAAGAPVANFPAALTGSGIQALSTSEGTKAGAVDLFAPRGVVNAGDAGIVAGDLTIGATAVLGADNISVSGASVGVPVDSGGFGAALTGASAVGAGATNAADDTVAQSRQEQTSSTPLADQALGFLDVFVTGFGEPCDPAKEDCRKNDQ